MSLCSKPERCWLQTQMETSRLLCQMHCLRSVDFLQVHKFVVGVAPVRSLCRVGWAAKQLLAIPADQLRSNSPAYTGSSDVAVGRQLRRGVTALARAVTLEALGLGASVAGGADYVLRGGSGRGSEQPAGKLCVPCVPVCTTYQMHYTHITTALVSFSYWFTSCTGTSYNVVTAGTQNWHAAFLTHAFTMS